MNPAEETLEDDMINRLKDDRSVRVIMTSGREYVISMQGQLLRFGDRYNLTNDVVDLRQAIFERWLNLIT